MQNEHPNTDLRERILSDGTVKIYDSENSDAWIVSDTTIQLEDADE